MNQFNDLMTLLYQFHFSNANQTWEYANSDLNLTIKIKQTSERWFVELYDASSDIILYSWGGPVINERLLAAIEQKLETKQKKHEKETIKKIIVAKLDGIVVHSEHENIVTELAKEIKQLIKNLG